MKLGIIRKGWVEEKAKMFDWWSENNRYLLEQHYPLYEHLHMGTSVYLPVTELFILPPPRSVYLYSRAELR